MKKLFRILLIAMVMLMLVPDVIMATPPYATYTYSYSGEVLSSPTAYVTDSVIDSAYMALPTDTVLTDPRDMFVGPDDKVYIVDAGLNTVFVLDRYYKYLFKIDTFINEQGVPDTFANPSGVFVNEDNIFVCDSDKNRIVMFDTAGNFIKIIPQPVSNYFEEGSIYKPVACAVDDYGRIFVVSSTTYQGIIVINTDGEFFGFIGAQKVSISALEILWRNLQTEAQKIQQDEYISTEFNNITIDDKNFVYVTTSSISETDQQNALTGKSKSSDFAPVKKLNASGADVMRRNGIYPPSGEVKITTNASANISGASRIVDVAIGPEGTWSIVDQKRSKIFTYDDNGTLLFAFGDKIGTQIGNIESIKSIVYQGSNILVLDQINKNIIRFRRTEYADLLIEALHHDNERMYDVTIDDWSEILKRNNNFDSAYIQIGKSLYRQGKYEEAMEYYQSAYDTSNYSEAYKEIRKQWANKYFWCIPVIIVAVCVLFGKFLGFAGKVNKRTALKVGRKSLKEELLYVFHVIFHPFDGFWDLKHEQRGSIKSAFTILLITIIVYFYNTIGQGYIFNPRPSTTANIMGSLAAVVAPLVLWVVANWCLTTLFEGEGSMKDIFIACCYCLAPLPLLILPSTIASNFLAANEGGIITLLSSFAYMWMGLLLFFAMMVTHDYSVGKNILTCVASIVGMAFIMFIGILFSSLVAKMVTFISNIVEEINYRL